MAEQNTSATGGYLQPNQNVPQPLQGDALIDFFQAVLVGILGVDGSLVRPRWQGDAVPNLPEANENWFALGCTLSNSDTYAYIEHEAAGPDGEGSDTLLRQQDVELLVSAYGPAADSYLELLRDGLQIPQNREKLSLEGMALVDTGDAVVVPSLVMDRWLNRVDMRVTFTRSVKRIYPILNLLSAEGDIKTDSPEIETNFVVE